MGVCGCVSVGVCAGVCMHVCVCDEGGSVLVCAGVCGCLCVGVRRGGLSKVALGWARMGGALGWGELRCARVG